MDKLDLDQKKKYYLKCTFSASPFKGEKMVSFKSKYSNQDYCFVKAKDVNWYAGLQEIHKGYVKIRAIVDVDEVKGNKIAIIELDDSRNKRPSRFTVPLEKIVSEEKMEAENK